MRLGQEGNPTKNGSGMNIRSLLVLTVGGVAAFFLHREQERGTFAPLDRGHVEWLLANRKSPVLTTKQSVILARLDDVDRAESERQFESWPPSQAEWSPLLDELSTYAPKTLVVQSATNWGLGETDATLKTSATNIKNLLLGTRGEGQGALATEALHALANVKGDVSAIPNFQFISGGEKLLTLGKIGLTQIDLSDTENAKPSVKDSTWRIPLLFRQGTTVVASLALQALLQQAEIASDTIEITLGNSIRLPSGVQIPIDPSGAYLFHDTLINNQSVPMLNLDTFKMNREQIDRFLSKTDPVRSVLPAIKDSLVWVAEDDAASKRYALPDGRRSSLGEMYARALIAMQTGRNVFQQTVAWQAGTLAAILLFGLWLARLKRKQVWKWGFFGALGLGLASMLTFQSTGEWMPVGPGLILIVMLTVINLLVGPNTAKSKAE